MSDAVLRAMERPGAVASFADRVHRLNARLRAGRVSRDRVDLAAWCGSESAIAVLGRESPPTGEEWWTGLRRFGGEVCARATAHVLLAVVPHKRGPLWPFPVDESESALSRDIGASLLLWCDSRLSHAGRNESLEKALRGVVKTHHWPDEEVWGLLVEIHSPMSLPPLGGTWGRFWVWAALRVERLDQAAGPPLRFWAIGEES